MAAKKAKAKRSPSTGKKKGKRKAKQRAKKNTKPQSKKKVTKPKPKKKTTKPKPKKKVTKAKPKKVKAKPKKKVTKPKPKKKVTKPKAKKVTKARPKKVTKARPKKKVTKPKAKKVTTKAKKSATKTAVASENKYNVEFLNSAFTPLCDDNGTSLSKIQPYLPVLNACKLCPGHCCRLVVKVSLADVIRLCSTLSLPFFSAVTVIPSTLEDHSFKLDRDHRIVPEDFGWPGRAEFRMKKRADGGCACLLDIGDYQRCAVYDVRPSICRLYPAAWKSRVGNGGTQAVRCPVPYGVTPAQELQFYREANVSIDHWAIHDMVVAEWNEQDRSERTVEAFLEFAVPRTAKMMGVSDEGILVEGTTELLLFREMLDSKVVRPPPAPFAQNEHLLPKGPWAGLGPNKKKPDDYC